MTLTTITSWAGGALGTNPTTTTEPMFSAQGGTASNAVYSAAIGGESGQAVRVTATRDFTRDLTGSHWRIGMRMARVAGTQTAGLAALLFRNGTTNVGDVFLRNQNGGQWALRAGAGGTTYIGQSTVATANGETPWKIEVEYESDGTTHNLRLFLFRPGNNTGVPDDTFAGTVTAPITNVRVLNPTGTTGLTMDHGSLLFEDTGAPIWATGGTAGTLTFLSNVFATQSEVVIVGKVDSASAVAVTVGATTVNPTIDSAGYFRASVTGLAAATATAWEIKVDGVSRRTGTITTLPNTADGFKFLWGSCFDTNTSAFFGIAAARNPQLIAMLGDWGYQYITGGPNGNTSPTDVATCRLHREPVLSAAGPQALFTSVPVSYTFSDCDGGGANSDGTTGGLATGAVQAAYRQQFAHPTLPLSATGARSWVVGRVRFIQTDETAAASLKTATDNSSKTKLGAEQKAWFKAQIDAAKAAGQAVVWFGDGPWIEPALTSTVNSWRAYNTERTELGLYIQASRVKLIRLHGDTHTLFYDDGTNNPWGGFPTASAAPFHTTAQPFSFTTSGPSYPAATTNSSRQYGVGTITDNGNTLTLNIQGFSSTNAAPAEVERYNATIDLTPNRQPWDAVYIGSGLADALYVGDTKVWP